MPELGRPPTSGRPPTPPAPASRAPCDRPPTSPGSAPPATAAYPDRPRTHHRRHRDQPHPPGRLLDRTAPRPNTIKPPRPPRLHFGSLTGINHQGHRGGAPVGDQAGSARADQRSSALVE